VKLLARLFWATLVPGHVELHIIRVEPRLGQRLGEGEQVLAGSEFDRLLPRNRLF
jgi:hypothetical protein